MMGNDTNGKVSGEAEELYRGEPLRDEDYNRCERKLKDCYSKIDRIRGQEVKHDLSHLQQIRFGNSNNDE